MRILVGILMVGWVAVAAATSAAEPPTMGATAVASPAATAAASPNATHEQGSTRAPSTPPDGFTLVAVCFLGLVAGGAFVWRAQLDNARHLKEAEEKTRQARYEAEEKTHQARYKVTADALALLLKKPGTADEAATKKVEQATADLIDAITALNHKLDERLEHLAKALENLKS